MKNEEIIYRDHTKKSDMEDMKEVLASSGFFYDYEISEAADFLEYQLEDGDESGIHYIVAEDAKTKKMIGFICFGFDYCTVYTYTLYWMAVHNDYRRNGIGKILLQKFEKYVQEHNGKKIVGDTSGRDLYKPTREFYARNGYKFVAEIPDYYSKGDSRITILKDLD